MSGRQETGQASLSHCKYTGVRGFEVGGPCLGPCLIFFKAAKTRDALNPKP